MAKGKFTAGAASAEAIPADANRDHLVIQHTNATQIALAFGEAAVAGEGVQLIGSGDVVKVEGAAAREAVYAIGDTGTATWQGGEEITVLPV